MAEAVRVLVRGNVDDVGPDQLLADEASRDATRAPAAASSGDELRDRAAVEDLALDRSRAPMTTPLVAVERVEARLEERVDRRRHDDLAVAAVLAHHREHLLDVERVPGRRRGDALAQCPRRARRRRAGSRSARRTRPRSSGSSRSDVAFSFPPPQPGRTSSSSVRATQRRKIGASRERSATCSTRSTKTGSAHCRSSMTTTCGRSAARASSSRRKATLRLLGRRRDDASRARRRAATSISTSGQYVIPSPYERQRPRRTSAESPTRSRKSATRRDLPIPAGPSSVKSRHVRSATASS